MTTVYILLQVAGAQDFRQTQSALAGRGTGSRRSSGLRFIEFTAVYVVAFYLEYRRWADEEILADEGRGSCRPAAVQQVTICEVR